MAQEHTECGYDEPLLPDLAWSAEDGGDLVVTGEPGAQWSLRVTARFGTRSHAWDVSAVTADEAGVARLPLAPPLAAMLDPLATAFVTDLSVWVLSGAAPSAPLAGPPAFLAWDAAGVPTLWNEVGLARHAPNGVLDPSFVPAGLAPDVRVLPPLHHVVAIEGVLP